MTETVEQVQKRVRLTALLNGRSLDRESLEAVEGQTWNTQELQRDFTLNGFLAPFCSVTRKSDGVDGLLVFQHSPRFYFRFVAAEAAR